MASGVTLWRAALLVVSLTTALCVATPARADTWTSPDGDRVTWDAGLSSYGQRVRAALPGVRADIEARLGLPLVGPPADVHIVRGHDRMQKLAGGPVPEWAAGVCAGPRGRIVLRGELADQGRPLRSLESVFRHEWVHLAWRRRAGKHTRELPRWVEEGIAEEIGGGLSVDGGAQLDFAAAFDHLIPFPEIAKSWPHEQGRASLAYRQGRSWVAFMVAEHGWSFFRDVLADLAAGRGAFDDPAAGPPFDELIWRRTKRQLGQWTEDWRAQIEELADPWYHLLLRDFQSTIFFVVAVLCGIGFLFLRVRRRRQIAALPDE